MSVVKTATVQSVLNHSVAPGWLDNVNQTDVYARLFGFEEGPARVRNTVRTSGNTSATEFGEDDVITANSVRGRTTVEQYYKRAYAGYGADGFQVSLSEVDGYTNVADLIMDEAEGAVASILDLIDDQINADPSGYNYATGKKITPIRHIVADDNTFGSQIVAGGASQAIDRTSVDWFSPLQEDNGGTARAVSKALMRKMKYRFSTERKKAPKAIMTNPEIYDAIRDIHDDKLRVVNAKAFGIDEEVISYDNKPVIPISGFPNIMIWGNPADFSLKYLPQVSKHDKLGKVVGPFKVRQLPSTKDEDLFAILIYMNLFVKNPYDMGIITDILTTTYSVDVEVSPVADGASTGFEFYLDNAIDLVVGNVAIHKTSDDTVLTVTGLTKNSSVHYKALCSPVDGTAYYMQITKTGYVFDDSTADSSHKISVQYNS